MQRIALASISFYRAYLSPYKGFSCAYCLHKGGLSCSAYGHRAIQRHGVLTGVRLIQRRLKQCGEIFRKHAAERTSGQVAAMHRRGQAGFCDVGCDIGACDLGDLGGGACDVASNCGSVGDCGSWGSREDKKKKA